MKRRALTVFIVLITLLAAACGSSGSKNGDHTIDGVTFSFKDSVRNDKTGKLRISLISDGATADKYALDYYKEMFEADDEIHAIVNFQLKTTTRISVMDGSLDVSTLEYVDGEEHDANQLFSGMLLAEYLINIESGEVEQIN